MISDEQRDAGRALALLTEALDALPDAVAVMDYGFVLRYVNSFAVTLLERAGIVAADVIGQPVLDALPYVRNTEWEDALTRASKDRTPVVFERHAPTMNAWTETRIVPSEHFMTSITRDVSLRHEARRRAAETQDMLDAILGSTADAIVVKDRDGHYVAVNRAGAAMAGMTREELLGKTHFDFLSHDDAVRMREIELAAMTADETVRTEQTLEIAGEEKVFQITRSAWHDAEGRLGGVVGVTSDVTDRRRRERETQLLADAGRALAESLDYRATLTAVARLVTPALADWCAVQVRDPKGGLLTLAVAHADPERVRWAEQVGLEYPAPPDSPTGVPNVIRTGVSELYTSITDEMLVAAAVDERHLGLLRELEMRSALIVPMTAHGKTLGAITLIGAESGRHFTKRELPLIEEIARRSALAVENAELFGAAAPANRTKWEFLASMSHELRTPLNAVIGYAALLSEEIAGPLTPRQQEQLTRIRASAGHLLALIDEVLSFSRMEAGQEHVTLQPVDAAQMLEEAAALVRPMVAARQLSLVLVPPHDALLVSTDPLKLRQILVNLLGNAIKFTDVGTITLSAARTGDEATFAVRDTGIGISAAHVSRVFEPFWQVEQKATRRVGGTGLGLSVTRRLARLLGGDVRVESVPGEGSTFSVTLPLAPAPQG